MAEEPDKQTKRTVKNPETFRERAIKAADASDQPTRSSNVLKAGGKVVKPVLRPVARAASKLANQQPFKFIGKFLFPVYFRDAWRELRQVTWPNWQQSRQLTFAVLVFAVIFGVVIAIVDYGLDKVFRNVLLK